MLIQGGTTQMSAQHYFERKETHLRFASERLVTPDRHHSPPPKALLKSQPVHPGPERTPPPPENKDTEPADAETRLLKALVEILIGKKIDLSKTPGAKLTEDPPTNPAPVQTAPTASSDSDPAQYETTVFTYYELSEFEYSSVNIGGEFVVSDADGNEAFLQIQLNVTMERAFATSESSLSVRQGRLTDPLVINMDHQPVQLNSQQTQFDLDSDGTGEGIATLDTGSAYLALDINSDGEINNGSELFGPSTGNGFQELASYDLDGNGFIDSGDPVFAQLQLYRPGDNYRALLSDTGIAALSTQSISSPFQLKDSDNNTLGVVNSTGFFIEENGTAGSIQQIDLRV